MDNLTIEDFELIKKSIKEKIDKGGFAYEIEHLELILLKLENLENIS